MAGRSGVRPGLRIAAFSPAGLMFSLQVDLIRVRGERCPRLTAYFFPVRVGMRLAKLWQVSSISSSISSVGWLGTKFI